MENHNPHLPGADLVAAAAAARRARADAPFLAAARGEEPSRRPVWMMRQAGRSLPEYRELRKDIGMLDSCFRPDLLAEITLQPVRRHDADAAILFSDIVVPLKAAGVQVDIVAGRGPVLAEPIRTADAIDALPVVDASQLDAIVEGIGGVLSELRDDQVLIGFAGAPFTLASYLIEGGPSKNHGVTKSLMYSQPQLWHALMEKLTPTVIQFLQSQIGAGVDAVQLFDSWAGVLTLSDYREYVAPYSARIIEAVRPYDIPVTHFGVNTGELLGEMAAVGPDILGIDWKTPLDVAARRVSDSLEAAHQAGDERVPADRLVRAIQGNLDPAVLLSTPEVIADQVRRVCAEADRAVDAGDACGHIFNLGHGVLPETPADAITRAFAEVHEL